MSASIEQLKEQLKQEQLKQAAEEKARAADAKMRDDKDKKETQVRSLLLQLKEVSSSKMMEDSKTSQVQLYADVYPQISAQANSFLTQMITILSLYATVTGAAWIVLSGNAVGLSFGALFTIGVLHIVLSLLAGFVLWGVGNNFIQRLNFAQWIGRMFWSDIGGIGGEVSKAWYGIPDEKGNIQTAERWRDFRNQRKNARGNIQQILEDLAEGF